MHIDYITVFTMLCVLLRIENRFTQLNSLFDNINRRVGEIDRRVTTMEQHYV